MGLVHGASTQNSVNNEKHIIINMFNGTQSLSSSTRVQYALPDSLYHRHIVTHLLMPCILQTYVPIMPGSPEVVPLVLSPMATRTRSHQGHVLSPPLLPKPELVRPPLMESYQNQRNSRGSSYKDKEMDLQEALMMDQDEGTLV